MGWLDISSAHYKSSCGSTSGHTAPEMLDATDEWWHLVNHVHELQLDLGTQYNIKKMRFKGAGVASPTDIDIYVSSDGIAWGAAVATGVDPHSYGNDWREIDVTDKTGRYVKFTINSTVHGNDLLGWGDAANKMIDIWEGDIPDKFTSHINLINASLATNSLSYTPTDGSLLQLEWDGSKYTNIIEAYLEITGYYTEGGAPDSLPSLAVQLYDRTNSAQIGEAVVPHSSPDTGKSVDISGNLPAGIATLDLRIKKINSTTVTISGARLVIIQESTNAPKTRIYIPLGASVSRNLNTYARCYLSSLLGVPEEKDWEYLASNFATIDAIYYHANFKASSGYTAYAKMDTVGGGTSLVELSTTSISPDLKKSTDLLGSISDSTDYTTWIKSSAIKQYAYLYNAYVVIDLSPVSKFQNFLTFNGYGRNTTSTGWTEDRNFLVKYHKGNNYYVGCTEVVKHHSVHWHKIDTNMETSIYDDTVRNSSADLLTTNQTPTIMESGALIIVDDSDIAQGYDLGSSGFMVSGSVGWGALSIYLTNISSLSDVVPLKMLMNVGI